jgi:hypothetical protein
LSENEGRYYDREDNELKAAIQVPLDEWKCQGTFADGIRPRMMLVFFNNEGVLRLRS